MEKLDHFDLAILRIIQKDNSIIQRDIGESVNLSAAAVQRRIKRMKASGVIQSNVAVIDPLKIGKSITLFVEIVLESEKIELIDAAKKKFNETPEVQQCYYVTGKADFILIIVVPTMADYEELTRKLFFEDNNIKRFETFVAMDRVKVGLAVQV